MRIEYPFLINLIKGNLKKYNKSISYRLSLPGLDLAIIDARKEEVPYQTTNVMAREKKGKFSQ